MRPGYGVAALVLAATFALGGVAGGAASHFLRFREFRAARDAPPGQARVKFRLAAMRHHLDLTDEQERRIEPILVDLEREREAVLAPCRSGLDALHDKAQQRIGEVLTPEQRVKFDAAMKRFREHGLDGPPGPPP